MGRMPPPHAGLRFAVASFLASAAIAHATPARADDPPPARVNAAAEEYDKGRRAFLAKSYEQAAVHFENAFRDAPRVEALRSAIRARRAAKQLDRAATLAALALERYADDAATAQLAKEVVDAARPAHLDVKIACSAPCSLVVDGRVAPSGVSIQHELYLTPGAHELSAGFRAGNVTRSVEGRAGESRTVELVEPPPPPEKPEEPVKPPPQKPAVPPPPPPSEKPLPPWVFFVGAGLTVGAGAATAISGLDAQNNPGVDAVRRECAGKDETCPLYQEGKAAELRTNVLLGVTAGLGVATGVIGLFFTRWRGATPAQGQVLAPYVGVDRVGVVGRF